MMIALTKVKPINVISYNDIYEYSVQNIGIY